MNIRMYETLPPEAVKIRKTVFVEEQGFQNEFDKTDDCAKHLVLFKGSVPVATCRFFKTDSGENYIVGRIAVLKPYRGQNAGSDLLQRAESEIAALGGTHVFLHAQCRVKRFYERQGYSQYGEIDYDEEYPHIWMGKKIGGKV